MFHIGFHAKSNADLAEKTYDRAGLTFERRLEIGVHYFYFASQKDVDQAGHLVIGQVDASLEDGEW